MKKKQESEGLCATPVKNDDGHEGKTSDLEAMRTYHVYVMASRSRVLYVGVTNDLPRRVEEHKRGLTPGFTSRYRVIRLVYFEEFGDIRDAIAREKEIKGWRRLRKIELVVDRNPMWEDLAEKWLQPRTSLP